MKKRTNEKKRGTKFSTKIVYLTKVADDLYETREKVIAAFEKKELVEPNFEWIRDTEAFNGVLDMVEENIGLEAITDSKIVNLKRVSRLIGDILSDKINNKYEVEKIYREIMEDENLLRRYRNFSKNENTQTIATISNVGFAAFGLFLLSKDNVDDIENVDIRDMSGLESEEDVAIKGTGLKIMTPSQLMTRQAGNNSQKLNSEIRQIIYSLYRSKNLSKTLYNHLINSI